MQGIERPTVQTGQQMASLTASGLRVPQECQEVPGTERLQHRTLQPLNVAVPSTLIRRQNWEILHEISAFTNVSNLNVHKSSGRVHSRPPVCSLSHVITRTLILSLFGAVNNSNYGNFFSRSMTLCPQFSKNIFKR